ncbi:MAG: accessory factor UbiK family protein [Sterolibacterium sp.]|nr:accessory factor UbiK family protein [Sterolibacterium sp.]MBP9799214.1 accessory factor UbiK family protein [Sterolibacterium sp.]
MLNPKLLDEVTGHLAGLIANSPARDIEKNLRALLTSALARLDLVTREEFEVQTALLARCQEQLARLEARLEQREGGGKDAAREC